MGLKKNISAFDLDETLLTINCSFDFGKILPRLNKFSIPPTTYCITYYLLFKAGLISLRQLHESAFKSLLRGRSLDEITKMAESFADNVISEHLYFPAFERLKYSQSQNHHIILMSSSPIVLVKPIAKRLGIEEISATTYHVDDNGRFSSIDRIIDGNVKAATLTKAMNDLNIDKTSLFAYSDSYLDLPFLQVVGNPVGVNPDRRLKKVCILNGWEII